MTGSFRELAETMDPVRPPDRLRGRRVEPSADAVEWLGIDDVACCVLVPPKGRFDGSAIPDRAKGPRSGSAIPDRAKGPRDGGLAPDENLDASTVPEMDGRRSAGSTVPDEGRRARMRACLDYETAVNSEVEEYLGVEFGTPAEELGIDVEQYYRDAGNLPGFADGRHKSIADAHRWRPARAENGKRSFRRMVDRHEEGVAHRFLWYNTFLIDAPPDDAKKPELEARRREIGRVISESGYDVVGLSEVFERDELHAIRDQIAPDHPGLTDWAGSVADDDDYLKGSGLYTMAMNGARIVPGSTASKSFDNQGEWERDSDFYADKGVQYTEVDLGPGHLDLFTTHLLSGGGLGSFGDVLTGVEEAATLGFGSRASAASIREDQIDDLGDFVRKHRNPENVTMVAGDFNVDGRYGSAAASALVNRFRLDAETDDERTRLLDGVPDEYEPAFTTDEYGGLLKEMARLGLQDVWLTRGGQFGSTHGADSAKGKKTREESVCPPDPDSPGPYCKDYVEGRSRSDSGRIDFVFAELPRDSHSFDLDITRMRRRPFRRNGETMAYMSDHLGLEMTLLASPA